MGTRAIGLDIGTHAVRAVELSLGRGRPSLLRMGQVTLPPGAVTAGEVVDVPAVSAALRRLWREVGFRERSVIVGVANARVVARMTDLPRLPEDELRSSLQYQVQDLIPIPVDEAELDFQLVDPSGEMEQPPDERMRVLLVAAHKEMLRSLGAALEGAGLSAARIDLIPLALIRAVHDPGAWMTDEAAHAGHEVIIGSGAGVTNVVVHRHGVPQFVRTLPTGGAAVTEALAFELGIETDDAEALKRGIAAEAVSPGQPRVDDLATTSLAPLAHEVAGSLDFHVAQTGSGELRRLVLSGGGGRLRVLQTVLEDHLGVPVVGSDPFERLDVTRVGMHPDLLAASADLFTVAVGLALGAEPQHKGTRQISLVSSSVAAGRAERRQVVKAGVGVAGLGAVLVGLAVMRGNEVDGALADARRAESEASSLEVEAGALSDVAAMETDVAARKRTVIAVLEGDVAWPTLIQDVNTVLPDDVWLTSFTASGGPGSVPTIQVAGSGFGHTSVAGWLQRAETLPALDRVWLSSASKTTGSTRELVQFTSDARLTPAAGSRRLATYADGSP